MLLPTSRLDPVTKPRYESSKVKVPGHLVTWKGSFFEEELFLLLVEERIGVIRSCSWIEEILGQLFNRVYPLREREREKWRAWQRIPLGAAARSR